MRKLIRTRDFRLALSHAIDRKTINEVVYFGLGTPSQAVTSPYSPWGRTTDEGKKLMEEWRTLATEYDVDKANTLLDGIGLDKKDSDGYRLRSDGKRLTLGVHHRLHPGQPGSGCAGVCGRGVEEDRHRGQNQQHGLGERLSGPSSRPASTTSPAGMPGPATTSRPSRTRCSPSAAPTGARR